MKGLLAIGIYSYKARHGHGRSEMNVAGAERIELSYSVLETEDLPLIDAPNNLYIVPGQGAGVSIKYEGDTRMQILNPKL